MREVVHLGLGLRRCRRQRPGDAGGSLYVIVGNELALAGVILSGDLDDSLLYTIGARVDAPANLAWLKPLLASIPTAPSCLEVPHTPDPPTGGG